MKFGPEIRMYWPISPDVITPVNLGCASFAVSFTLCCNKVYWAFEAVRMRLHTRQTIHALWLPNWQTMGRKWAENSCVWHQRVNRSIQKMLFQAWNFVLERARPFLIWEMALPLETLKVYGKLLKGHQGQDQLLNSRPALCLDAPSGYGLTN